MRIKGIRVSKKLAVGRRIRDVISAHQQPIIISDAIWRYISKKITLRSVSMRRSHL